MIDLDTLQSELEEKLNEWEKKKYLSEAYPSLYILMLEQFKRADKIEQYMAQCKEFENDRIRYSLYIHGYLLPWFDQQRKAGKLKQGRYINIS